MGTAWVSPGVFCEIGLFLFCFSLHSVFDVLALLVTACLVRPLVSDRPISQSSAVDVVKNRREPETTKVNEKTGKE